MYTTLWYSCQSGKHIRMIILYLQEEELFYTNPSLFLALAPLHRQHIALLCLRIHSTGWLFPARVNTLIQGDICMVNIYYSVVYV